MPREGSLLEQGCQHGALFNWGSRLAKDVKSVLLHFDQELVANLFRKYYNLLAVPVVDQDNKIRGVITLDDVLDVIDEENTDDIYQASGISMGEDQDEKHLLTAFYQEIFASKVDMFNLIRVLITPAPDT